MIKIKFNDSMVINVSTVFIIGHDYIKYGTKVCFNYNFEYRVLIDKLCTFKTIYDLKWYCF